MKISKTSQILTALFSLACAIAAGYLILRGSGMFPEPSISLILLTAIFIILLSSSRKSFYFILLPLVCLHAIYTPTGLNFGAPSYQYIASVLATDMLETKEFLMQIPVSSYLAALAIPVLVFLHYKSAVKFGVKFYRNKTFIALATLLIGYNLPIAAPLKETIDSSVEIVNEWQKLKKMSQESSWGQSTLENSKYQDYVIILGESARKDYLHAYGYPVNDTPFMSSANGTLIDGMTSAGTNTVASLRLMLTLPDKEKWEPNYDLSLVDLIKSAGLKTYWLSNQGFLGEYDTPVASLASKSDETIFLKKGGSFNSTNYSDFDLIPKFAQVLEDPTQGKRFIVLHIYGSHPLACDRVEDYPKIFNDNDIEKKNEYLNCYITSIKKTDDFIKKVYETLKENEQKTHRTFSMIYFSDHADDVDAGLGHDASRFTFDMARIPLYMYFSDNYIQKYPHTMAILKKHTSAYFTNDLIFDTLINIMQIPFPVLEETNSLADKNYKNTSTNLKTLYGKKRLSEDPFAD